MKFLSEEWAAAVRDAVNSDESFMAAAAGKEARIQQVVTGAPDGDVSYWVTLSDGDVDSGVGEIDAPDATITQDYATAVQLAKGELSAASAYFGGQIQIQGDLMKLMGLQSVLGKVGAVLRSIDAEY
ncbi:MAG: SCP2 sterol-binding domain-containing protein [Actinomycetota bacterium]